MPEELIGGHALDPTASRPFVNICSQLSAERCLLLVVFAAQRGNTSWLTSDTTRIRLDAAPPSAPHVPGPLHIEALAEHAGDGGGP